MSGGGGQLLMRGTVSFQTLPRVLYASVFLASFLRVALSKGVQVRRRRRAYSRQHGETIRSMFADEEEWVLFRPSALIFSAASRPPANLLRVVQNEARQT